MAVPPSQRLRELGLVLPPTPAPKGSYAPAVVEGSRVYVSGQIVSDASGARSPGRVGREVDPGTAKQLAREVTLQGLAAASEAIGGSIDHLKRAIRVGVFVASADDFHRQHEVADGATELLNEIFGDAHRPARAAVGVLRLPLNAPVEIDFVFERE